MSAEITGISDDLWWMMEFPALAELLRLPRLS